MPDMIPVATQIKTPDPMAGINTYAGILGIKQQEQALQIGQYLQQSAQATASQDQQKNQEFQAAQSYMRNGIQDKSLLNSDGSVNRTKAADGILAVAPTYGQDISNHLISGANEMVNNKKALLDLGADRQQKLSGYFGAVAAKPDATKEDILTAVEAARGLSDDPAYQRMIDSNLMSFPATDKMDPQSASVAIRQHARLLAVGANAPSAAESAPVMGTTQAPGGLQAVQTSPQSPLGVGAIGRPIPQAPHQTTNAAGQIVNVTPGGTVSTAPTAGPAAGGANPTTAQASVQNTAAAGVANRVQQAQAAANNTIQAQDALTRARTILDSAGAPNTGKGFETIKDLKNLMSGLGIDTQGASDANSLVKNLARYEASRATQAGLGGTDAARELAHNGSPNVSIDNAALKGIVTQSLATEKALATYANIQSKARDPGTLTKNETDFRSIPHLIEGYEYGLARNKAEADEFLRKHGLTPAEMAKTRQMIKEFESR